MWKDKLRQKLANFTKPLPGQILTTALKDDQSRDQSYQRISRYFAKQVREMPAFLRVWMAEELLASVESQKQEREDCGDMEVRVTMIK